MDLIEQFLDLSIKQGSSLASIGKKPKDLDCVVALFIASCVNSAKPTTSEAEKFLSTAGQWISATPQELLDHALADGIQKLNAKINLSSLTNAVNERREQIRIERRRRALEMEKEAARSRVDTSRDQEFMTEALLEAKKAMLKGEVPVGAVVVDPNGNIIGRGHNLVITEKDPSAHAEIQALKQAAKTLENYRLDGCSLYVTLEPCPMCSGAVMNSRIQRLIYGVKDPKGGCVDSVVRLFDEKALNSHAEVTSGVLQEQCLAILQEFFGRLRKIRG